MNERKEILQYWKKHNQSTAYSIKLDALFKKAVKLLAAHPRIGRLSDPEDVRVKLVRDYLLIYEETDEAIHILTIRHGSRNPDELGLKKLSHHLLFRNHCKANSYPFSPRPKILPTDLPETCDSFLKSSLA